jgi:hypothetical protein
MTCSLLVTEYISDCGCSWRPIKIAGTWNFHPDRKLNVEDKDCDLEGSLRHANVGEFPSIALFSRLLPNPGPTSRQYGSGKVSGDRNDSSIYASILRRTLRICEAE